MFCTKCGTNNEDNNVFCKNCGAKLVKPATNNPVNSMPSSQDTSSSSGVAQAAKAVNVKLIGGIAAALVVVVVAVVVLLMNGVSGGDSLFEQIKIGKTTAADVKKYFDKNNLDYDWGCEDTLVGDYLFIMTPDSNFFLDRSYFSGYLNGYGSMKQYAYGESTIRNTLSDTLWGAECEYFTTVDIDDSAKDKKRDVLCTSCIVTVEEKSEEKEFRQKLNEYIKKHQKTDLKKLEGVMNEDTVLYPLEIINLNGSKALVCLYCNLHYLETDRKILLTLYAENYFSDKEINKILEEYAPAYGDTLWDIDDRFLFEGKIAGIYGGCDLNDRYIQYKEEELKIIKEETPDFTCRIDFTEGEMNYSEIQRITDYSLGYIDWADYELDTLKGEKYITIEKCDSDKSDITIPESIHGYPVKGIADDAFSGCKNMKSIKIPDSVINIGSSAFSGCSSLTEIELPSGITMIGDSTFSGCSELESIKFPDYITTVGSNAFSGCSSLTEITLPNGITEIKDGTFSGCSSLTDVKIPSSVTTIGDKAFNNCGSLVNINIDNNITIIADDAFDGCEVLVSVELNIRFPNAIPKPAWLEAYRNIGSNYGMTLIGANSKGVPYLVTVYGCLYIYNGSEVESITDIHDISYNPNTNKLYSFSSTSSYFVDLYTGKIEASSFRQYDEFTDWNEVYSYYDGDYNEISEEKYKEIVNAFGNVDAEIEYYNSIDEAYQAYISNGGSISVSGSVSAANASESADTALVDNDSALDNNINIDVESEVKQIRQWYSDTQNGLDNLMYSQYGDGIEYYFELGYAVKGIISSGYDGWDYTRQYFYKDQKLYFAFVFKGSEEYRVYFKDGKVIRYIDNNGTVYDYGNIGDGEQLGQKIIAESDKLYPEFNCGA